MIRSVLRLTGEGRPSGAIAAALAITISLLFVLWGVPTSGTSVAERPAGPGVPSSSTVVVARPLGTYSARARSPEESAPSGITGTELCLSGAVATCTSGSGTGSAEAAPVPLAGEPSSWTNITPPKGAANPYERELPAEAYYPNGHEVVLFGGYVQTPSGADLYEQDTWGYANGHWTDLVPAADCTATTCPSPRAGAGLAYDADLGAMILFGGEIIVAGFPVGHTVAYSDTWMFENDTWTNVTSAAATSPSARFDMAMTYDPSDDYVLLFGGLDTAGTALSDTWKYSDGDWTNLSSSLTTYPEGRYSAAIAYAPDGYVMMFGGATASEVIQNPCDPVVGASFGAVAAWYYKGAWTAQYGYNNDCPPPTPAGASNASNASPTPATGSTPSQYPPCGRVGAALGWSPKNNRFVVYGGYGTQAISGGCSTSESFLNDSWTYDVPNGGGGFTWNNASKPAGPPARAYMGYASDYTDDYFEIFGGLGSNDGLLNATWRFYEVVYAKLTGPLEIVTQPGQLLLGSTTFSILGYGGTGELDYKLDVVGLRNTNKLSGNAACTTLQADTNAALPDNGTWNFNCVPNPKAFNVYRVTLTITDEGNSSHPTATSNWTVSILPPESIALYSEYVSVFYSGIDFSDTFGLYAEVADGPPTSVVASIAGRSVHFDKQSFNSKWWNASVPMANVPNDATLHVEAFFDSNWSQNVSYTVSVVTFPSWLSSLVSYSGANQTINTGGRGPWNRTFTINESYAWNLADSTDFSLPVELLGGAYDVIPSMTTVFSMNSQGLLSISATLPVSTPSIDIGPASLDFMINVTLTGTFDVAGSTVQWVSASATLSIAASLSASVPIYGFSILGISVGFYLDVTVSASFALTLILAPTQPGGTDLIPGIDIMVQKILGVFTLALSASVDFGIGIASVGLGAGISVALSMTLSPSFSIGAGWVNGSIFATASFLFWSDSWDIVSGTIYSWDPPLAPAAPRPDFGSATYNNNGTTWGPHARYYEGPDYDAVVWNPAASQGPAVSDIYPYTSVAAASTVWGSDLFYTNDNTSDPVTSGLGLSGLSINSSTNAARPIPAPNDSRYLIAAPEATALAGGGVFVLWEALPTGEAGDASPLDLTSLALQGARYDPANGTWGPIETFSTSGFSESYQVDAQGAGGSVLELVAANPLIAATSSERLVTYNLTSAAVRTNTSTSGLSEIVSFRAATGEAVVETLGGNYSLYNVSTGTLTPIDDAAPADAHLVSAAYAEGSASTLVLLYRTSTASEVVLADASTGAAIASQAVPVDAAEAEAIAGGNSTYVLVRTAGGLDAWSETGGTFTDLPTVNETGVTQFGLAQSAGAILVYALERTGGNASDPILALALTEIGSSLPPAPGPAASTPKTTTPSPTPAHTSSSSPNYSLILGLVGLGVVVLLAVLAIAVRPRKPAPPTPAATSVTPPSPPPPPPSAPPSGG